MKLEKHLEKLCSEHKLDHIVNALVELHSWDRVCLAFSNLLVFKSNACKDKKKKKELYAQAKMFHKVIEDMEEAEKEAKKQEALDKKNQELDQDKIAKILGSEQVCKIPKGFAPGVSPPPGFERMD
jgi:hypothetical protein